MGVVKAPVGNLIYYFYWRTE